MTDIILRDYQQAAVDKTLSYIKSGRKAGLVVMPTASGKAFSICAIIKDLLVKNNSLKVMNLTHVKELISQNYDSMKTIWPTAPAGIYSASVGFRQFQYPVVFGGIQSCFRKPEIFGRVDVIIIDEAHLVSDKAQSMYGAFLNKLKEVNPNLVVIGFTATPYRLGMGYLTEGPMFDDVIYDISTMDEFVKLIDDGYLCDLVPYQTDLQFDLSEVKKIAGDFSEKSLDENINLDKVTREVVAETVARTKDRNKGISFCVSVAHAENMTKLYCEAGLKAVSVNGAMRKDLREEVMSGFKSGKYNMLCNVGVATTGLDVPDIDYIVMCRPTQSTALHVQMMGRGMRVHSSKTNCMVLDFAGNTERLGPVNDPIIPVKKGKGIGEAPIRICRTDSLKMLRDSNGNEFRPSGCGYINHASVRRCKQCESEFVDPDIKVYSQVRSDELIKRKDVPKFEFFDVNRMECDHYTSRAGNKMLAMNFFCGDKIFDRYLDFEKKSKMRHMSLSFWNKLAIDEQPSSNEHAVQLVAASKTKPKQIKVWTNKPIRNSKKRMKDIMEVINE